MPERIVVWSSHLLPILCSLLVAAAFGGSTSATGVHATRPRQGVAGAAPARACPGADPCPYSSVSIVGRRGEGVLRFPEALAVAPDGEVLVADQYSYVVQRFTADGRFLDQWGSHGDGPGEFGAVGGLAVDGEGDVYLIDAGNDRVEELTLGGRFLRAWGSPGSRLGQFRFGEGAPGAPPGGGVAVAGGYVYVSDSGNDRIERFTLDGAHPFAWGTRGNGPGAFEHPAGLAVRGDELYVADANNDRIDVFHTDGSYAGQSGPVDMGAEQLMSPMDVAIGPAGRVYVADDNNHRVVELTAGLGYVTEWALHPLEGEPEGWQPNRGAEALSYPRAVAVSATGWVYVADAAASRIDVIHGAGGPVQPWGVSARSYGQFILPRDVAATPGGGALTADMLGRRVELFEGALVYRASFRGGAGIVGHHLFEPVALARASDGSLWVTDQENGLVRHLSAEGELLGTLGGVGADGAGRLLEPGGVAIGAGGEIYVADTGEGSVKRYSPSGAPLGAFGGDGSASGRLRQPVALAIGPNGEVYVVDVERDSVERFTADGRYLSARGGPGRTRGRFNGPDGIAVDAAGHVFVADGGNDRIEELDARGRFLRMWGAPGGQPGDLSGPAGLSIDCAGALLVADTDNNRVQRFNGVASSGRCG